MDNKTQIQEINCDVCSHKNTCVYLTDNDYDHINKNEIGQEIQCGNYIPQKMDLQTQKKNTELQIQNENTNILLKMAIDKNLDVDKLEKLIALKEREEAKAAKKEFDFHFFEMQKEFEPIDRTKDNYSSKYAPLEMMTQKYGNIISKHGFSYRWREESTEIGKKVTIIISGWGHTDEKTSFEVPQIEANSMQNIIQVAGVMSTYGKRYTFKSAFGISEKDEDTDGNFEDGILYSIDIMKIRESSTMEELASNFREAWDKYTKDTRGREIITIEKDKRKKELKK